MRDKYRTIRDILYRYIYISHNSEKVEIQLITIDRTKLNYRESTFHTNFDESANTKRSK